MEPQLSENESARLNALRQYKILDTPPEAVYDDVALLAAHICETPIALVSLVDSDRQWFKSKIGLEIEQTERAISFCTHAILEPDDVFIIPDAALDERFAHNPLVIDEPHIRFYAGVPLVDRDGYPLGALCVLDHQPRELKAEQIAALRTLRRQLVTELELRRAISERDQIQNTLVQTQDELKTRSETEIALLQAKNFAENLIAAANAIIVVLDVKGNLSLLNKAAEQITGYTQAELAGRDWFEMLVPRTRYPDVWVEFERLTQAGSLQGAFENPILTKSGEERIISWRNTPLVEHGRITGTISFGVDVTEKVLAEKEIRQERDFSSAMLDSLPGVFYLYNEERHFLRWNDNFTQVTGYSDAEMAARHPLDFFAGLDEQLLAERIQAVFTRGEADVEADFVAKDGTRTPYYFTGKRILLDDQICLMGVGIDISGRKLAEDSLRSQERFLSAIVDTSPAIVYIYDMETQSNVYINNGIEKLLGYAPAAVQAMGAELFGHLIHPDDLPAVVAFQDKVMAAADEDVLEIEYRMRYKDGSWCNLLSYERPFLRNDDGSLKQKIGIAIDITENKRAQEALRLSEARYADLYENAPDMYVSVDAATGKILQCNQTLAQMTGFLKDEIVGRSIFDMYHPHSLDDARKAFKQFLATGEVRDAELQLQCRDGRRLDVSLSVTAVRDETGKIVQSRSVWRDITQRKQAEDARRQSEERFSNAFHVGPAAMTITRIADGKFINVNNTFLDLFGFSREEVINHTSTELKMWTPEERKKLIQMQLEAGGLRNAELIARTKSGQSIHLLFSSQPMEIEGESCHLTTLIDISELKQAEERLRESEARYRQLLDVSPVGVAVHVDRKIVFTNPAGARLLGAASPDELIGKPITSIIHPDNLHTAAERIQRMMAGEQGLYPAEDRYLRLDGSIVPVEVMAVPLTYEGQPGVQVMVTDISERKRAEETLRQLNSELEERVARRTVELEVARERAESADRLKSAFLATMSHELRTPLNSIIGFTGILLQELPGKLNMEQSKQLGMVQGSARHLLALINDVLDISKIEAGQLEVGLAPFDMFQLVEKVAQTSRVLVEKKGLALRVDVDPAVGVLTSDQRRVEQILINLVNNAIKFTERGEVGIRCWVENGRVLTCVADSGIGIKPEDMDKLFQPFQQVQTGLDRKVEGTGLGLSICRKLVGLLAGEIWVESEWGVGSAFTFALPLAIEAVK